MSDLINGVKQTINVNALGAPPVNKKPENVNKSVPEYRQVTELQPAINHAAVKTPLSYVKTGEITLPYGLKASSYKLSNGQKVIIVPKEGETVLKTYVNTGSMNEPDRVRGISHYIEHNLFNGSDGLEAGEFFKTTDKMGANTNASTGLAETNYFISSHLLNDDDLEKKIKIHASMLESPRFAADMLEKEKGIVNSEINMITSDPENVAYNRTLKNLFNIKSTSSDIIAGNTSNITNLTRENVVDYFNRNYYPANMVTVVTGEVEPEDTMKLLSKYFSSQKAVPGERTYEKLEPLEKAKREDIISDKANSTTVVLGFAGPENNNSKDRIYVNAMIRMMLDSREAVNLFNKLNTSVDYMSEKISIRPGDKRALMLSADVSEDNSEKLLKVLYSQISKYQNVLPTEEEMNIIKRDMKYDFARSFEYSSAVNNKIGEAVLENNLESITDYEKIIDNMTPQDIQNAAKKYFNLNKAAITVVHPSEADEAGINANYKNAASVAFTGQVHKQVLNMENVKQYNLANNYRVVLNDSALPNSVVNFKIIPENVIKPQNPAAYSVLNDLLSEGSKSRNKDEMTELLRKHGLYLNISANYEGISVGADCDKGDISKALDMLKEVVETPRFDEKTFEEVKANLKDSLLRSDKTPGNKLYPELYRGLSYTKEDILQGLETLTLSDVQNLYSSLIANSKGIAVVSAPFSENPDIKPLVFNKLSTFNSVLPYKYEIYNTYEPQTETKVLTDSANKNQAKIVEAYKFKLSGNLKDEVTIELLNTILGGGPSSRLFNDLREQQKLAYSVRSNLYSEGNTGVIALSIGTTTDNKETGEQSFDNLQKSIDGFKHHIERIKSEPVSQAELDSAKLSLKNLLLTVNESVACKTGSFGDGLESYYGLNKDNAYFDMIDKITVDDIYNAAQYVFAGKPVYSIVATSDTLKYNEEYLNNLVK